MAYRHRRWAAHTVERRQAWHAIIAFGQHRRSNDVECGMPLLPLGSTHGRTTSDVAYRDRPWVAHTVERRRAWHAVIAFGQHTRSNDFGRGMPSWPLGSTYGRATSGVPCTHRLWAADTVDRRRAWHAIIAFGKHTRSNDVERGMQSSPLAAHTLDNVKHGMTSPPLDSTHGRQRRAWHDITALGQQTRLDKSGVT